MKRVHTKNSELERLLRLEDRKDIGSDVIFGSVRVELPKFKVSVKEKIHVHCETKLYTLKFR